MVDAFRRSPNVMATWLYSRKLISKRRLENLTTISDCFRVAMYLLLDVQAEISSGEGDKKLRNLCEVMIMSKFEGMKELSAQIMEKYGKFIVPLTYALKFCAVLSKILVLVYVTTFSGPESLLHCFFNMRLHT